MPIVLIRHPDGSEQQEELTAELTLGRSDGNDVLLTEGGVSRKHARFFVEGGKVMVEDAGSANGTFVDGEQIDGPTVLGPRAQVVIGDYEITVKGAGGAKPRAGARAAAPRRGPGSEEGERPTQARPVVRPAKGTKVVAALERQQAARTAPSPRGVVQPGSGPALRGLTGPWLNQRYPVEGSVVVGRVPSSDVQVDDDSVSRRHAELEATPDGVLVRDLGSANGTTVNGNPINEDTLLKSGDVLQFGVIEMAFEEGAPEVLKAPVRRKGRAVAAVDEEGEGGWSAVPPSRKRLIVAGGGVGLLLFVAVVVKSLTASGTEPLPDGPRAINERPVAVLDPGAQIAEYLAQCRSHVADQDWARAETACNKALDEDPIHPEANGLIKKIRIEKECSENFAKGEKSLLRLREEDALELFGKIGKDCSYYFKAKPRVKEAVAGVMKRTAEDCKRYSSDNQYETALPRCELYMKFACQSMKPEQLYPPPGHKVVTAPGRLRRGEWRPSDPSYLKFLVARARVDPQAPPWKCPPMEIFKVEVAPPGPRDEFAKVVAKRYPEKDMSEAMLLYFDGKAGEAQTLLLRIRERQEKAVFHAQADDLRKQITSVDQLYKEGEANLQAEEIERAAEPFREALSLDAKLLGEQFEKTQSFYRRNIVQDMAAKSYEKGKLFADRQDWRKACKLWRLGFAFYKGNAELLRALGNVCSSRAVQELANAASCSDLVRVAEFAVDGDGIKEKIEGKKAEWSCQ